MARVVMAHIHHLPHVMNHLIKLRGQHEHATPQLSRYKRELVGVIGRLTAAGRQEVERTGHCVLLYVAQNEC